MKSCSLLLFNDCIRREDALKLKGDSAMKTFTIKFRNKENVIEAVEVKAETMLKAIEHWSFHNPTFEAVEVSLHWYKW